MDKGVFYIFLVFVAFTVAYDWTFEYQIREGRARFVEKIETNLEKKTVKIYTPAHNNILESYKFQDFQRGKQIKCLPLLRQCRLREIDIENAPEPGQITESFVHSWNAGKNSISKADSTEITELYYVDGEEVHDTVTLGEELTRFYESFEFPLYVERKVPDDTKLYNMTNPNGHRKKRKVTFLQHDNDCGGAEMKRLIGFDTGADCNYLKLCNRAYGSGTEVRFADCKDLHITSPLLYQCACCPDITVPCLNDCTCFKMGGNTH